MAMPPATQVPMISPAEMQILVSRTGLVLNPGQVADLVLAWRQVAGLIASLPQSRPLADDSALAFRLPPPSIAPIDAEPVPRPAPRLAARKRSAGGLAPRAGGTKAAVKRPGRSTPKR